MPGAEGSAMPSLVRFRTLLAAVSLALVAPGAGAVAQTAPEPAPSGSRCLAIAQDAARIVPVAFVPAQDGMVSPSVSEVTIRFVGHSTFLITSPDGVTIATDYNGFAGGSVPRIATMNHAHGSHYTDAPDPRIEHVLRGWNPAGGPARHNLQVGDVLVRNVPTDIRRYGTREPDGNSIFIFEVAQLCIGHLGHLHHVLDPEDLGVIGQLDVVMVPVDGGYTMDQGAMLETLQVLKARLVLPMHYFTSETLGRFLARLGEAFEVEMRGDPQITVSVRTLPASPKVMVLPGY
jgi:L-ascorbate metabolism protein UlaG (beta-lactamase superfamily)